ncbi:flagellar basal body rod protein FlgC [Noviherbaspirillum suwonense]|uniref:Flagellar basal-body rod protein FlgC n=1 Tax=Noviherbaspirillum suwonense TaxID=1224511 RepID=A0ABY1QLP6_9BURK|nr:flagellar basal body rod protein FlgC [Noviherbaspirillum suwonense]SMP74779.1 flagellar basal-body rod protein FlgC [Noviherbaspirillum suwonense]
MDYQAAFAIGAAGMAVEKMRADLASLNLANANTTRTANGGYYRAGRLVTQSAPGFDALMQAGAAAALPLPHASGVVTVEAPPRLLLEPGHPHADSRGFVAYPQIDTLAEMVTIMNATRAYQANIASISAARSMAQEALKIGGGR